MSWFKTNKQLRERVRILEMQKEEARKQVDRLDYMLRKGLNRPVKASNSPDLGVGSSIRPEPSHELAQFLAGVSVKEEK